MNKTTKSLHAKANVNNDAPTATPIYQASAFEAHSDYFYTRNDNPNSNEFEQALAILEETKYALSVTTGMAAINIVLNLLKPGQTLLINKHLYGCSFKLFQWFCENYNVELVVEDLSDVRNWKNLPKVDMVLFETPTNPFLYTININKLAQKVKSKNKNALVVVDNTWATPYYQKPCAMGADISLHSATKYLSGHSDVMGGIVLTNEAKLYEKLRSLRFYFGNILPPFSAWLLRRSLFTLEIRLEQHKKTTNELLAFIATRPEVKKLYYPDIDGKQLTGYPTLIFFELAEKWKDKYKIFSQNLSLFSTGTGMACVTSMVAQPFSGSHASMNNDEKYAIDLTPALVRLSFGMENSADLKEDLTRAFDVISEDFNSYDNHKL